MKTKTCASVVGIATGEYILYIFQPQMHTFGMENMNLIDISS